ncbi:helix-turn-helix domain-containing protein [Isoptericola aurantiacus]|uniref:helix-turn-helix domain-containing protein n=1 Tax=Isoptericola aurantiacus TaxID=3377839 RepID=UPI00383AE3C6
MTQQDAPAPTAGDGPPRPRYRGRHLPMVAVVVAAFIATALAYSGMVLFGLEVANMEPLEAYALAGFLEVSLVAVALMARNAALEGRPYGVLLTLTWILSGTSGVFAALHEVAVPTASTPYMVVFRFVPPLVAALMWHLALVGERHLVTGHTLDERRREHRVHQYVTALEVWRDARLDSTGDRRGTGKVRAAHEAQRAARDRALKLLTVEDFERRMQVWVERLEAAERHGNRLDLIGADSVKRGTARGTASPAVAARPPAATAAVTAPGSEAREPLPVRRPAPPQERAGTEPFGEAFGAALTAGLPERSAERPHPAATATSSAGSAQQEGQEATAPAADATPEPTAPTAPAPAAAPPARPAVTASAPAADSPADAPRKPLLEPLPETGHTRRVEVFDLVREEAAEPAADRPAWHATSAETGTAVEQQQSDADDAQHAEEPSAPAVAEEQAADPAASEMPANERDRRIVELAREGLTQREIAEHVEASRSTVSRVVRRYEDQKPQAADADLELAPA